MATYYVSHAYGGDIGKYNDAKKVTHDLQIKYPQDCFLCPLIVFSHIAYGEIGYDAEIELCLDLLSLCDGLIVAGKEISYGVQREIEFAKMVGMEVRYLESQNT